MKPPKPESVELDQYTVDDVPDTIWPSNNAAGIPTLRENMQATALELPFSNWGASARKKHRGLGTTAFYVDDYRFERLWREPHHVANTRPTNIIEPNFSTSALMPAAVAIFQIYKKRYLARWWQELGIRVFVDLNVDPKFAQANLLGVPPGWKAYATHGSDSRLDWLEAEYKLAVSHARSEDILFVVYGGGRETEKWCRSRPITWIPEQADDARRNRNGTGKAD